MFCLKCGAVIEDGSLFCPECGTKVEDADDFVSVSEDNNVSEQVVSHTVPIKIKKPINKKAIIIVAAIVLIAIIAISVISTLSSRVSINKYINSDNLVVSGYNGYGKVENSASSVLDIEGLENALGTKKVKKPSNASEEYDYFDDYDFDYSYSNAFDYIDISFRDDNTEALSNGDEITIDIKVDYDKINNLGYKKKLVGKDEIELKYTVSGLEDATTIDPFSCIDKIYVDCTTSYISLNFEYNSENDITRNGYKMESSIDGHCSFYMESEDEVTNQFSLYFASDDILDDLKTGDKYKVVVQTENDLGLVGLKFSATNKAYSVDCLNYLKDESKIQTDLISEMKQYIEEKTGSKVASQYFYYYKDWDEEKKSFKELDFLVKSEYGYTVYNYPHDEFKISDSGSVIVNFENSHEYYREYGKIKDYEDERSDEPEVENIKKITLS